MCLLHANFLIVQVFSYFHRETLSVAFVLAAIWPPFMPAAKKDDSRLLCPLWSVFCLATSIFTLLPVEKGEDIFLV